MMKESITKRTGRVVTDCRKTKTIRKPTGTTITITEIIGIRKYKTAERIPIANNILD
jgi:Zn-finger protein